MPIGRLDHVNLRTHRVEEMVAWYTRVLDMPSGPRPNFPFPGAWLYADGLPTVHLNGVEKVGPQSDDLTLEHFAFKATDLKGLISRLQRLGEKFSLAWVPGAPILQVNVWDPDGNHIHIDFDGKEAEGLDLPKASMFGAGGRLTTM